MKNITINSSGKEMGPYSMDDVSQLLETTQIQPNDLAYHEGLDNWISV